MDDFTNPHLGWQRDHPINETVPLVHPLHTRLIYGQADGRDSLTTDSPISSVISELLPQGGGSLPVRTTTTAASTSAKATTGGSVVWTTAVDGQPSPIDRPANANPSDAPSTFSRSTITTSAASAGAGADATLPQVPEVTPTGSVTTPIYSESPESPTSIYTGIGSPTCHANDTCHAAETARGHHRGMVAGTVVGGVAGAMLIFGVVMCYVYKLRHKSGGTRETDDGPERKPFFVEKGSRPSRQSSQRKSDVDHLGEPGPAVSTDGVHELATVDQRPSRRQKYTLSSISNISGASDPFRTPTDCRDATDVSQDAVDLTCSQIGLALTRYSTAQSIPTVDPPRMPDPAPASETMPLPIPPKTVDLNRTSSTSGLSAVTTDTDRENEPKTLYIGKAQTQRVMPARRHSLTPRIINIVGAQTSSEQTDSNELAGRVSTRARSESPAKRYTGSPAKLKGHFGVQVWDMTERRTSSEQSRRGRDSEDSETVRGRSSGCASYPPTSYPR